jgi:hypothetical protein
MERDTIPDLTLAGLQRSELLSQPIESSATS